MRAVRVVAATVVLLMATHSLVQFPGLDTEALVLSNIHRTRAPLTAQRPDAPERWYATPDYELFVDRLEALKQVHEDQVTHALTAIDAFGNYVEEVRAAEEGLIPSELIPVNVALWERLHTCEQSDTWYANGTNSTSSSGMVFQGGLGMATSAWQMAIRAAAACGVTLPRSALESSVFQQMVGAQAFHDAYGWGWACRV